MAPLDPQRKATTKMAPLDQHIKEVPSVTLKTSSLPHIEEIPSVTLETLSSPQGKKKTDLATAPLKQEKKQTRKMAPQYPHRVEAPFMPK